MILLVNHSANPFKIQYRDGSKALVKQIPSNQIIAMKGLRNFQQISNLAALAKQGVILYDFESGRYYGSSVGSPIKTSITYPLGFLNNNVKSNQVQSVSYGYSGSTSASAATFSIQNVSTPTVYGIIITASTNGTSGVITATTVGANTYVSFKGNTTSAQLVTGLTANSSFVNLGIIASVGNSTPISASTFYLSASTRELNSGYVFLKRLV